jgi:hypothetical protein
MTCPISRDSASGGRARCSRRQATHWQAAASTATSATRTIASWLFTTTLGLRYETTDNQFRFLLGQLRELLYAQSQGRPHDRRPAAGALRGLWRLFAQRGDSRLYPHLELQRVPRPSGGLSCCAS